MPHKIPPVDNQFNDYDVWCETHPCSTCHGTGEVCGGDNKYHACGTCDGSGIDPDAEYEGELPL